jgi:proline dehydrogenase
LELFSSFVVRTLPFMPRPLVWRVARRYVAGATLDDALATARRLRTESSMTTVDVLGEAVTARERVGGFVDEYVRALEALAAAGLDVNVSIKPTMFGLLIDEGFCQENLDRVVATAKRLSGFVRIDMEDRTTTDATLRMYKALHARHGCVGVVLQAYMRRTLRDIDELPETGANVRLCKGIYIEPRGVAWKGYDTVRSAFVAALEKMLTRGVYVGIATHDEYLCGRAIELIDRLQVPRERYEMQMLLGVEDELRRILVAGGHRLRVYVPYGGDWHLYSLRRLRENPAIAGHVTRAFLGLPPKVRAEARD